MDTEMKELFRSVIMQQLRQFDGREQLSYDDIAALATLFNLANELNRKGDK